MATYAIGDVQGCFDELQALLEKITFNSDVDRLWFVGDLINRGPQSLITLRWIKNLKHVRVVLGNHDFHLLALASGHSHSHHTLQHILSADDKDELINWLRHQPLLYHDETLNYVMVHAGLAPQWDLTLAKQCAAEVEKMLRSDEWPELLKHVYGDQPDLWNAELKAWPRLRFITNVFTRMRFCDEEGRLEFKHTGVIGSQTQHYIPWFKIPWRRNKHLNIIFGHWAALRGNVENEAGVYALDTGCVWGESLTAMRLEDGQRFSVSCVTQKKS